MNDNLFEALCNYIRCLLYDGPTYSIDGDKILIDGGVWRGIIETSNRTFKLFTTSKAGKDGLCYEDLDNVINLYNHNLSVCSVFQALQSLNDNLDEVAEGIINKHLGEGLSMNDVKQLIEDNNLGDDVDGCVERYLSDLEKYSYEFYNEDRIGYYDFEFYIERAIYEALWNKIESE